MQPDRLKILVTGGSGFVGRMLIEQIVRTLPQAHITACADREAPKMPIPFFVVDLTKKKATADAVRSIRPTHIVHLAAISALKDAQADIDRAWDVNLNGTLNLAHAVLRETPETHFLHISSSDVYGHNVFTRVNPIDETALLDPHNPYAATKAAADIAIGQLSKEGLRAIRLRPFNHTGPGQLDRFVVPRIASQLAKIKKGLQPPRLALGNINAARDFLDVRDVVNAYIKCLQRSENISPGIILNLSSGQSRLIREVVEDLMEIANCHVEIETDDQTVRQNDTSACAGNSTLARNVLDWSPKIAWKTTLNDTLNYWLKAL